MRRHLCLVIFGLSVLTVTGLTVLNGMAAAGQIALTNTPRITPSQAPEGCWVAFEITGKNLSPKGEAPSIWFSKEAKKLSEFTEENSFEISPAFIQILESSANKTVLKVRIPPEKDVDERSGLAKKDPITYVRVALNEETVIPLATFSYSNVKGGIIEAILISFLIFFVASLVGGLFITEKIGKRKVFGLREFCKSHNGITYSLANTQILFWTIITVTSVIYIWVMTGLTVALNESILILLGIGGLTNLASRSVAMAREKGKNSAKPHAQASLKSEGFLVGIISFKGTASIFKLQMLIFTLVMGGMVIRSSFWNLQFPQVDETYLWLMGISNGVYAGDKIISAIFGE